MGRNLWLLLRRPASSHDGAFFISVAELGEPFVDLLALGEK